MQRHEVIDMLKQLKLYGMVGTFDETISQGLKHQQPILEILGRLCRAEAAERQVRSIRYQMGVARFPLAKNPDGFSFADSPVNEQLIRDLYNGHLLAQARNLIFIGGTGTGKTHLLIAIASHCIKERRRGRFFSVVNLVNQLELGKELGKAGRLAARLANVDYVYWTNLATYPFQKQEGHYYFI